MGKLLALLFYPALEIYLLVKAGAAIGAFAMLTWVFASALLGIWALRTQGQGVLSQVSLALSQGSLPQQAMLNGMLLFVAGVLLILPGLIGDTLGILLILPVTRNLFMAGFGRCRIARAGAGGGSSRIFFYSASKGFRGTDPACGEPDSGQATVIDSTATEITSSLRNETQGDRVRRNEQDGKTADAGGSGEKG